MSNELKKRGLFVSPGGVRSIWQRHKGLEEKAAQENRVLTAALERGRQEQEAQGEIETEHPG